MAAASGSTSLDLVCTIEDDDCVSLEESEESEDEENRTISQKPEKKKKQKSKFTSKQGGLVLSESFTFSVEDSSGGMAPLWDLKETIQNEVLAKGSNSNSLEQKILQFRLNRKRKTKTSADDKGNSRKCRKKEVISGGDGENDSKDELSSGDDDGAEDDDDDDDDGSNDDVCVDSSADESEIDENEEEKQNYFDTAPELESSISFTDMNLSRPLLRAVNQIGYVSPTPVQSRTIPVALMGKDICACAATGTGKTAAYMLPVLERLLYRPGGGRLTRVLVLVPTRELAIQVHSVSKSLAKFTKVEFCLATGGLDSKGQEAALRKQPDVIIATPGRLVDHLLNAPTFNLQTIEILILDEADRMLDEHFMEQMNEIIKLCPQSRQTMLFSATMTDNVQELVRLSLNKPVKLFVDSNIDVADNLYQEFVRIRQKMEDSRPAVITALCCRSFKEQCLVFFQTKRLCHRMRVVFGLLGLNVEELHGGLSQLQRLEALQKFKDGEVDYLLATDLAARGLDITGVKTVINYSMPSTLKQYIHRVGRTARAGRFGRSVTLVGEKERKVLKEVVKQAKCPVKSRIVPAEVIAKYQKRVEGLEEEVKQILKEEEEEKQMRMSEMEISKAQNLIDHEKEIFSRPARTWIAKETNGQPTPPLPLPLSDVKGKVSKKKGKANPKKTEGNRELEFIARKAKRERKMKRMRAYAESPRKDSSKAKGKVRSRSVIRAFDRELTDTSKQALREFRRSSDGDKLLKKKSSGKFKSRKRYKRKR